MDAHTAGGGFDTSTLTHRRQEPNTSNRIRPEPHRRPPSEKALQRPIEPPERHAAHNHVRLLLQLARRGQASYASRPDQWLFPGGIPGKHLATENIRGQLVERGIQPNSARKAAMFQLAGEIPTPILADILGLSPQTAVRWAALAARDWSQYTAMRRHDGPKIPALSHGRNGQETLTRRGQRGLATTVLCGQAIATTAVTTAGIKNMPIVIAPSSVATTKDGQTQRRPRMPLLPAATRRGRPPRPQSRRRTTKQPSTPPGDE